MTLDTQTDILAWHFVNNAGTLAHDLDHITVVPGLFLACEPDKLELCAYGFHASLNALDALQYAPGTVVCRVRLAGRILYAEDKLVASERTVLWTADATRILQTFAIDCAEKALQTVDEAGYQTNARSWAVLEVARRYLDDRATKEELRAARAAAYDAAAAAYAAAAAAAAAYAADVAYAAAAHAAADDAAFDAATAWQERRLTDLLMTLAPQQ